MKTLTSMSLISLVAFAAACTANTSEKSSEASGSDNVQLVGDTNACKDIPLPTVACANGPTSASCDLTSGTPAWKILCEDDTSACKDLAAPAIACANGGGTTTCDTSSGNAQWKLVCNDNNLIGSWGGEHATLKVDDKGAKLEFDCAVGEFGVATINADGTFEITGTFTSESGAPSMGWEPNPKSTKYWGTISGNSLVLYAQPVDGPDASKFDLIRDGAGMLYKCQ